MKNANLAIYSLRSMAAAFVLCLVLFGFKLTLARGQVSATGRSAQMAVAEQVVADVLANQPSDRTIIDLDASAEASYLLYGHDRNAASLRRLELSLRRLWNEGKTQQIEASRLEVVALEFGILSSDEIENASSQHIKDNSLFAFAFCSKLMQTGRTKEAQKMLSSIDSRAPFSLNEEVGLRALYKIISLKVGADTKATPALDVWTFYSGVPNIDLAFISELFHSAMMTINHHGILPQEMLKNAISQQFNAIQSLMAQEELESPALLGMACYQDLKEELPGIAMLSAESRKEFDGRISSLAHQYEVISNLDVKWSNLKRSGVSEAVAKSIINEGQMRFLTR